MFRAHLVIPAGSFDKLSCGQCKVDRDDKTDGQIDVGNDNTPTAWRPWGKKATEWTDTTGT